MKQRKLSPHRVLLVGTVLVGLSACDGFDLDLRNNFGEGFDTSGAVRQASAPRPRPDNRGVISYPNYQVAVAKRDDTISDVAARVGVDASELARYNGIDAATPLRDGEIIALPHRVAEPGPNTGAITAGPIRPADQIDVETLAGAAIERADAPTQRLPEGQSGEEPIRHKVERGETAYSIARLYNVSVRSLADWNGLGPELNVREGQFLLIPVASPAQARTEEPVTQPGEGSPTPTPPSSTQPLPEDDTTPAAETQAAEPESPALAGERTSSARLLFPVEGNIIRPYEDGRGIEIAASEGASVVAADAGTVAVITESVDGIAIILIRHPGNLMTVYANLTDIAVEKGDTVNRGQQIAAVRGGNPSFLRFEVRRGMESHDPMEFLN